MLRITEESSNQRLDKAIAILYDDISRTRVKSLIERECVLVNGEVVIKGDIKVQEGQEIEVRIPHATTLNIKPKSIHLDIIFEDESIIILNKHAGLTVHPGAGTADDTLVHALLAHCGDQLSSLGGTERPGIVHRLDRNTTGLLVIAKSDVAHKNLAKQIEERQVERKYKGVCWGKFTPLEGTMVGNIGRSPRDRKKMAVLRVGGKEATTHYKTVELLAKGVLSLVEFKLETGRTHQIRVHASYHGHSLLGDPEYGNNQRKISKELKEQEEVYAVIKAFSRQSLHAYSLKFMHPISKEELAFTAPLPNDIALLLENIRN